MFLVKNGLVSGEVIASTLSFSIAKYTAQAYQSKFGGICSIVELVDSLPPVLVWDTSIGYHVSGLDD